MIFGESGFAQVPFGDSQAGITSVPPNQWFQPLAEPVRYKVRAALAIAIMAWGGFVSDPTLLTRPEAPSPDKFARELSEPVRQRPSLQTANQQFSAFVQAAPFAGYTYTEEFPQTFGSFATAPFSGVPSGVAPPTPVYEDAWHQAFSEPVRFRIKPAQLVAITAWDGIVSDPALRARPEASTPDRFSRDLSEPVRYSPTLKTANQQFEAFVGFSPFGESSHTEAWLPSLSEPVRYSRRLATGSQQFASFVESDPFPEIYTESEWGQPLSEPIRYRPTLRTSNQQFAAYTFFDPYWVPPLDEPVRFRPTLKTSNQQFTAFVQFAPFNETVGADKWAQPLSEIVRYRPTLKAANQQFEALVQFSFPEASHTEAWTQPLSERVRYRQQMFTGNQQFLLLTEAIFVVAPPPSGWTQPLSERVRYRSQLLTGDQQFWVTSPKPVVLIGSSVSFKTGVVMEAAPSSVQEQMLADTTGYFAYAAIATPWVLSDRTT
jgi:tetrahydromethanopterin S-methyltransferase subunit F